MRVIKENPTSNFRSFRHFRGQRPNDSSDLTLAALSLSLIRLKLLDNFSHPLFF